MAMLELGIFPWMGERAYISESVSIFPGGCFLAELLF